MATGFASGKHALGFCDRCGWKYPLKELKREDEQTNLRVCTTCFEEEHPQLDLDKILKTDSQAIQNARPDLSFYALGNEGAGGSRMIQWGWNPIGGSSQGALTPNDLVCSPEVGTVRVVTT